MSIITKTELHGSSPPATINPRPLMTSFSQPTVNGTPVKAIKPIPTVAPRIDLEPIYTALKQAIGENWQLYKSTVAEFVTGKRNQAEMAWIVDPFLRGDASKEALHNQLILAIFSNAQRDSPDQPGVASWVAANDKPTSTAKPVTGDAAEQRLKSEIMHLPPRERRRIKKLEVDETDRFQKVMNEQYDALQMRLPDTQQIGTAGGYNRTNWEPEVRKRYAQPLFVESNEFPDPESIQGRMLPICFEEGIFNGFGQGAPDFMNLATESFIKNALTRIFSSTRSNGKNWVKTEAFKRKRLREEAAFERGEIRKSQTGLLPIEQEVVRQRKPLSMADVRLSLDLGGSAFGKRRPRALSLFEALGVDDEGGVQDEQTQRNAKKGLMAPPKPKPLVNGVLTNGVHDEDDDGGGYGWPGGSKKDRMALNSVLDDCLANYLG